MTTVGESEEIHSTITPNFGGQVGPPGLLPLRILYWK